MERGGATTVKIKGHGLKQGFMQGEKGSSLDGEPTRQEPQIKKQQQNSPK